MAVLCWHSGRIVNIAYHVITGSESGWLLRQQECNLIKLTSVRIPLLSFFSNLKYSNIYIFFFNLIWISFKAFSVFLFFQDSLKFYFNSNLLHGCLQLEYDVII